MTACLPKMVVGWVTVLCYSPKQLVELYRSGLLSEAYKIWRAKYLHVLVIVNWATYQRDKFCYSLQKRRDQKVHWQVGVNNFDEN